MIPSTDGHMGRTIEVTGELLKRAKHTGDAIFCLPPDHEASKALDKTSTWCRHWHQTLSQRVLMMRARLVIERPIDIFSPPNNRQLMGMFRKFGIPLNSGPKGCQYRDGLNFGGADRGEWLRVNLLRGLAGYMSKLIVYGQG